MPDQHTRARLRETGAQTKRSAYYTTDGTHAAARALPKRASGGPPGAGAIPHAVSQIRFRQVHVQT